MGQTTGVTVPATLAEASFSGGASLALNAYLTDAQGNALTPAITTSMMAGSNGAIIFAFPPAETQSLGLGAYTVYAQGDENANNSAILATRIASLSAEAWTPNVTVSSPIHENRNHGTTNDLGFTFDYAQACGLESQTIICELWPDEVGIGTPAASVQTNVMANATYPLTIPGGRLKGLAGEHYAITLRAEATDHTAAIPYTTIGMLDFGTPVKYRPCVLAQSNETRVFGSVDDLSVTARLAAACPVQELETGEALILVGQFG